MKDFFKKKSVDPEWKKHWKGLPEYFCDDLTPIRQILISFKSEEDIQKFSELMQQTITDRTKSIWYPKEEIDAVEHLRYVDEKEI